MQRHLNATSNTWDGPAADLRPEDDDIPWCRVPERKVTIEDVKYVLSLHYQGTPFDPYGTLGTPASRGMSKLAEGAGCSYRVLADEPPFYIEPTSPEIQTLLATYDEYTGREGKPLVIGGGTYARHFGRACAFGPYDPDEQVPAWVGMRCR